MNLRKVPKKKVEYLFSGHTRLSGTNNVAVNLKNDIIKYMNTYINMYENISYSIIRQEISSMLRNHSDIASYHIDIHNHIIYITWLHVSTQNISLRIMPDVKKSKDLCDGCRKNCYSSCPGL